MTNKENINHRIAIGAGWMVALRMADRLIGLVSIAILARLLLPFDFGLVAYAMAFFAILEMFFNFSFETVLIRDQNSGRASYDTAWTLNILIGVVLGLLLFAGAKPIALFFQEPEVENILHWMAILPAIRGLANIGIVDFQKKMDFNKDFVFNFSVRIISAIVTVVLAYSLRSYWALVFGNITKEILRVMMSFIMSRFRPRLDLSMYERVFGFSFWLLIQNILSGINHRLPVFVIGRYFPAQVVAYFNIGFELSHMASQELAAPIRRALFPGVAIIAEDRARLISTIASAIGMIALIGMPMTVGIAITAPLIVPVMLGPNWSEVIPIIQILSINAISYVLYSNCHIVFLALNRPKLTATVSTIRTLILIPVVVLTVPKYGAIGAAWSFSAVNVFMMCIEYLFVFRMIDLKLGKVLEVTWRSIAGVSAMAASVYFTYSRFIASSEWPLVVQLLVCVGMGAVVYSAIVFPLWKLYGKPDHAESYLARVLQKSIAKLTHSDTKQTD